MLIDREKRPTVELDFDTMHLTMLYALAGETPPAGDGYEIHGYLRQLVKTAFNTLVNAKSTREAVGSLAHDIYQNKDGLRDICGLSDSAFMGPNDSQLELCDQLAADVIRAIKIKHKRIKRFFGSDMGVKLQKWQADIMLEVCERALNETGRSPFPIHDGCVVADLDADACREIMREVSGEHGLNLGIKTKSREPVACADSMYKTPPTATTVHMGEHPSDPHVSITPKTELTVPETSSDINFGPTEWAKAPPKPLNNPHKYKEWLRKLTDEANERLEHAVMPDPPRQRQVEPADAYWKLEDPGKYVKERMREMFDSRPPLTDAEVEAIELRRQQRLAFEKLQSERREADEPRRHLKKGHDVALDIPKPARWEEVQAKLREYFAHVDFPKGWEPKITEEERLAYRRYHTRLARQHAKIVALADAICWYVGANPGTNQTAIVTAMRQEADVVFRNADIAIAFSNDVRQAINWAEGRLRREKDGRATRHYLVTDDNPGDSIRSCPGA